MGRVIDFKPRKPSDEELYSEEYIIRQYELNYQEEMVNIDEEAWERGRDFLADQLTEKEQEKEVCFLARFVSKIFA